MSLLIFVFHSLRSLRFFYVLKSFLSVTNTPITFGLFDLISILSGDIKLTESNAIIRYIASLSISSTNPRRDENAKPVGESSVQASPNSAVERSAYNGVHRVYPGKDRGPITAIRFAHNRLG